MQLVHFMEQEGINAAELARKLGCQKSTVSRWVNGENPPQSQYIPKLCQLLKCSSDELFGLRPVSTVGPKTTRRRFTDLHDAITQHGFYNSDSLHQIATAFQTKNQGKPNKLVLWIRGMAEALYKIELTTPLDTLQAIQDECEQMMMF